MIIFIFALILIFLGYIFHLLTKRFLNPYKLIFVFGRKGSGKSIMLEKLCSKWKKKGWLIYSTEASDINGYRLIDPRMLYKYDFPRKSCIFIDEVSLIWDNRDFKSMDKQIIEWFRYQRKKGCRVYLFSQTFDIDKKLRDLADEMLMVNKIGRVLVRAKRIIRKDVVVHPSPEAPARIDADLVIDGPLMVFFGGREYAWIPYWAKRYDTNRESVHVEVKG